MAAVNANRVKVVNSVGGAKSGLHVIGAAHSAKVHVVSRAGDGVTEGVDGLVTRIPDLALLGLGADCAVITFTDEIAGVIGAAHCGWQGLVKGIVPNTIGAMVEQGASTETIVAHIGPAICGNCYSVNLDRAELVSSAAPSAVISRSDGSIGIDIGLGVEEQCGSAGVMYKRDSRCTFEDENLYSFRRDDLTGRQGGVVVLRKNLESSMVSGVES